MISTPSDVYENCECVCVFGGGGGGGGGDEVGQVRSDRGKKV